MTIENKDTAVLNEISRLKELFLFGGEIIPFLEELFQFLRNVMPMIDQMSQSLEESTNSMTKVTDNISSAKSTSENATIKIIERLDALSSKVDIISDNLNSSDNQENHQIINQIRTDIFDIMNSLQFQDITSQQLEYADGILHAIYQKFNTLSDKFNFVQLNKRMQLLLGREINKEDIVHKKELENIKEKTKDKIRKTTITQKDIDELFK